MDDVDVQRRKPHMVEVRSDGSAFGNGPMLFEHHRFANRWCVSVHTSLGDGVTRLHGTVLLGRAVLEGWEVTIKSPQSGEIPPPVSDYFDGYGEGRWSGLSELHVVLAAVEAIDTEEE